MTTIENLIDKDKRLAKHNNREYNVFSRTLRDPSKIEKWVGLSRPNWVLMDPESYWSLRGERIEWIFDKDNILTSVYVHEEGESKSRQVGGESKIQAEVEEIEEESTPTASKVVEEKPAIQKHETPKIDAEQIEEEHAEKEDTVRKVSNTINELEL